MRTLTLIVIEKGADFIDNPMPWWAFIPLCILMVVLDITYAARYVPQKEKP